MHSIFCHLSQCLIVVASVTLPMCCIQNSGVVADEPVDSAVVQSVNDRREADWQTALAIWEAAEPGYQETKSSASLMQMLKAHDFRIQQGVAEIPTAFTAEFGEGQPVIGILGEFDALPGLSQTASAEREPRQDGNSYGHGCGHHLFGTASASAAIAIAEQIDSGQLKGTIRFYGCPAEEGGSAKVFLVQAGLFSDCDAVLHWHPGSRNYVGDRSTLARMAVKFRFHGQAAHAAGSPEQGRSALDAVALTNHAAELLREHCPEETRIHHVITSGGEAPNVVPAFAEVYYYIRHPQADILRPLYTRLENCAKGAALATGTELEIKFEGGIREILPNSTLTSITKSRLMKLNDLKYEENDLPFVTRMQQQLPRQEPLSELQNVADLTGTVGKGSTDVGDVSWVVPTTGFATACWVPGTPGHSWQAVACGGNRIAEKGMNLAARTLALSIADLMRSPKILKAAKAELIQRLGETGYLSLMQPGQKPPLDYRKPAVR